MLTQNLQNQINNLQRIHISPKDVQHISFDSVLEWLNKRVSLNKRKIILQDIRVQLLIEQRDTLAFMNILGDALGTPCAVEIFDEINEAA